MLHRPTEKDAQSLHTVVIGPMSIATAYHIIGKLHGIDTLIHSFQENDLDDGYYVMHNDSVFEIRRRTKYLKNMLLFIKPNTEKYKLPKGYWTELDLFNVVLNLCKEERLMAMIRLDFGEECYGYINDFDDSILEIETVDSDGIPDGIEYLRIEDVRVIGFGSLEANRRSKLFETQNNLN